MGPAPAQMALDAGARRLAFHTSHTVYVLPTFKCRSVVTKAAFGEKVPAKPPLSFQATSVPDPYAAPLTMMPTSWVHPAAVLRMSAPPELIELAFDPVGNAACRTCQARPFLVAPALPAGLC